MRTSKPVSELARKLATGLTFELCPHEMKIGSQLSCVKCVEAAILAAMALTRKQTIEECARIAMYFRDDGVERTGCRTAEVIRNRILDMAAIREMEVKA